MTYLPETETTLTICPESFSATLLLSMFSTEPTTPPRGLEFFALLRTCRTCAGTGEEWGDPA